MILHSGITLYHGSYVAVEKPELERCYPYKDFGRGFYLTTSQEQAVSFVRSSVAKAAGRGDVQPNTKWGFVSKYIFQADINIKIHEFPNADAAWLHCVASHRRPTLSVDWAAEWQDYDILAGKVANADDDHSKLGYECCCGAIHLRWNSVDQQPAHRRGSHGYRCFCGCDVGRRRASGRSAAARLTGRFCRSVHAQRAPRHPRYCLCW